MSEDLDVAVSPLRAGEPTGTDWTLEQLCKYGWVPKRIRVSSKFSFRAAADDMSFEHYEDYEFQGDEFSRICAPENWIEVGDGGAGGRWSGFDYDWSEVSSDQQLSANLGRHDRLPIFFAGLGFSDDYYYSGDDSFYPGQGMLTLGGYFEGDIPVTFTDALEIVTKDNAGTDVSFYYDLMSSTNGFEFPFTEWGEFLGDPYGFQFGEGDFIRYEVTEWLSYNGTWDTETGELLVADPWNP